MNADRSTRCHARRRRAVAVVGLGIALTGCAASPTQDSSTSQDSVAPAGVAERVLQLTSVHEETGMTLLEGPTFDHDGTLYVVDVAAPAGEPKLIAVDLDSHDATPIFTDNTGAYTSAQFSPYDGRLYLTDYSGGRIISLTADGDDPRTFAEGPINGRPMQPDDIAFDTDGNLFVTDSAPASYPTGEASGRVLRFDRETAEPTVLATSLPNPNGISFTLGYDALWVSQLDANRIDHLKLNDDRTAVVSGHTAVHVDGGTTQTDSNAVDASGNIYQGVHGKPTIMVYSPEGMHLTTVTVPSKDADLESATNIAIRPGTTDAYMTVSGPAGGFIYQFEALDIGVRQSNGG
ncbi:SMP-30/gluconolactonase/LRE family protein [Phytoactinopolyspora halotolerans]|uniref:SMP-30/gluconolactonase/LRE family protein n=1 Tax=Phytoactinopolyspora halotolerans TaxID=1981512 RepID=A0A6L9SIS0_9ACTN|nr:SMP-30/gluconolactonase/LRE family protein [Phytoactinopolyspora halotolerans]NEE04568.1 SMP-30/gluconolactonase/LRE family protein [Phytoactinopolyspora halotolerans]